MTMDDLLNSLFDIFTREVVASYDAGVAQRHARRDDGVPPVSFHTNENILTNARIIRQEFGNRSRILVQNQEYENQRRQDLDELSIELVNSLRNNISNIFNSVLDNIDIDIDIDIDDESLDFFDEFDDIKITLSESQFNNNISLTKNISSDSTCNICLELLNFPENGDVVSLKCNHSFHNNCIKEWLTKKSIKCPMCRYECERL
jgi:hypothetical protein